jgi:hypothetical protein
LVSDLLYINNFVTRAVRDRLGRSVKPSREFRRFLKGNHSALQQNPALMHYRDQVFEAIAAAKFQSRFIVSASVFTTQSTTAILEKIRDQIKEEEPDPVDFRLGSNGSRTVFPLNTVTGIAFNRQIGTAPTFDSPHVFLEALQVVPRAIGTLAFGKYVSPDYETTERVIPRLELSLVSLKFKVRMTSISTCFYQREQNRLTAGLWPFSAMVLQIIKMAGRLPLLL